MHMYLYIYKYIIMCIYVHREEVYQEVVQETEKTCKLNRTEKKTRRLYRNRSPRECLKLAELRVARRAPSSVRMVMVFIFSVGFFALCYHVIVSPCINMDDDLKKCIIIRNKITRKTIESIQLKSRRLKLSPSSQGLTDLFYFSIFFLPNIFIFLPSGTQVE